DDVTKRRPEKALTKGKPKTGGRNNRGGVTSRFIGGGHKQRYPDIDFPPAKRGISATGAARADDPNPRPPLPPLHYPDGEKRYILAPNGLQVGATVMAGPDADILVGNALPLSGIPLGTMVHNIELKEGKGGQMARSAGTGAQLMAREGEWATLRLPSGEMR